MKQLTLKFILALAFGLGLTLALLGLMTYLSAGLSVAYAAGPHHVAPNCAGVPAPCYTTVQAAVDAAAPGDVIKVAAGTYTDVHARLSGAFNLVFVTQTVYISKNLIIRGGYTTTFTDPPNSQANPAILDAQGQGRVLYTVGASPTIEGLQIAHGDARLAGNPLGNPESPGGGLLALSGNPVFSGNTVIANEADDGGGIYVFSGGAILNDNVIISNTASRNGGGVGVTSGTIVMNDNQVISNTAPYGGGLYGGDSRLSGNIFVANTANYGGGLYIFYSILTNTIVADNQAAIVGSGLHIEGPSQLIHSTIARNSGGDGSGVYVTDFSSFLPSSVALTNTILVSQTVGVTVAVGNTATLESTLWSGNGVNWGGAGIINASNNYTGNPAFVNPDSGNYHLGPTSAAINKGVNAGVTSDIDDQFRPQDGGFDLGADEYPNLKTFLPLILKQ